MRTALLTAVCFLLACGNLFAEEPTAQLDAEKLYGDWEYVSGKRDGDDVDKERLVGTVTITADSWTMPGGPDAKFVMSYKLDTTKSPATIDFKIEEGPVPEGEAKGLVELQDNELTLCYHPMGGDRPEKLESTADNGAYMFVLKRKAQ